MLKGEQDEMNDPSTHSLPPDVWGDPPSTGFQAYQTQGDDPPPTTVAPTDPPGGGD
jgi:hypothetical protein